jgi:prepilin-type processing-associated H-X9-DG protein
MRRKSLRIAAILIAFVVTAWLIQVTITDAPGQHGGNVHVTGHVTDKLVKSFEHSGLPSISSVQYRRFVMSPGAKMEGLMAMDDHAEFCIVEKGSANVTFADGSKRTYMEGEVFVVPKGTRQTAIVADAQAGFVELYWKVNQRGH